MVPPPLPVPAPGRPVRLLFVCWGNICRSPTAEAIMRRLVDEAGLAGAIEVDSVATSAEELGNPPDRRAIAEADRHGLDLRDLRARRVTAGDWRWADLLLVVDDLVERALLRTAPDDAARAKVVRITDFGPDAGVLDEVPDPWYGGAEGFAEVYGVLERACQGLLDALVARAGTDPR